jgi:hypothetical protein
MEATMATTGGARTKSSSSRAKSRASSRSHNDSPAKHRPANTSHERRQASGARRPPPNEKATEVREDIQHSAREAGQVLSKAAKKAKAHGKTPILIGSTALAGAAGGLALGARRNRQPRRNRQRKLLGGEMPRNSVHVKPRDIARTARQVGKLTETAGHIAADLRRANEEGNGKTGLSPIEVVLRGLTTRR